MTFKAYHILSNGIKEHAITPIKRDCSISVVDQKAPQSLLLLHMIKTR